MSPSTNRVNGLALNENVVTPNVPRRKYDQLVSPEQAKSLASLDLPVRVKVPIHDTHNRVIKTATVDKQGPKVYAQSAVATVDKTNNIDTKAEGVASYIADITECALREKVAPAVFDAAAYPPVHPQGRIRVLQGLPHVKLPIVTFTTENLKAIAGKNGKSLAFGIETGSGDGLEDDQKACRNERQNFMGNVAARVDRKLRPVLAELDLRQFIIYGDVMSPGDRIEHLCLHYQFNQDGLQIKFVLSDGRDAYHFGAISIQESDDLGEKPDSYHNVIQYLNRPWTEPDIVDRVSRRLG